MDSRGTRGGWGIMILGSVRKALAAAVRPTNLIGGIALVVVIGSAVFADMQNRTLQEQQVRSMVSRQVSVLRARLEGNINGNMQLVRGLVGTIATEPDMTQQRFASLAAQLFDDNSQLRDIAGAPGLKISLLYPVKGNEALLGVDYNKLDAQSTAIFRARDKRALILAGPVNLVQGGTGFVGRFPVFTTGPDGAQRFWGVISAVVDADLLYAYSGLFDPELGLDIALRGPDGSGAAGDVFYGDSAVLGDNPVVADIALPAGSWQILGRPAKGWTAALPSPVGFRLVLALAVALVLIPLFVGRHLINERARNIATLRQREQQLDVLSRRLGIALETSEVGVWDYNADADRLIWDDA
jgi:sensor domain CHASE-containing protein